MYNELLERIQKKHPNLYRLAELPLGAKVLVLRGNNKIDQGNDPFWSNWVNFKKGGLIQCDKGRGNVWENPAMYLIQS